jgi:hypothetical protein
MSAFRIKKYDKQKLDENTINPFAEIIKHGHKNTPASNAYEKNIRSNYEKYCQEQLDNMLDDMEDRCFGEMAEGQFVRSH